MPVGLLRPNICMSKRWLQLLCPNLISVRACKSLGCQAIVEQSFVHKKTQPPCPPPPPGIKCSETPLFRNCKSTSITLDDGEDLGCIAENNFYDGLPPVRISTYWDFPFGVKRFCPGHNKIDMSVIQC